MPRMECFISISRFLPASEPVQGGPLHRDPQAGRAQPRQQPGRDPEWDPGPGGAGAGVGLLRRGGRGGRVRAAAAGRAGPPRAGEDAPAGLCARSIRRGAAGSRQDHERGCRGKGINKKHMEKLTFPPSPTQANYRIQVTFWDDVLVQCHTSHAIQGGIQFDGEVFFPMTLF